MPGGQKVQQTVESVLNLATNHVDISHGQLRFHIVRRCGGSGTYVTYISGPGAGQQQRLRTFAGGQCIGRVGFEHALVFGGGTGVIALLGQTMGFGMLRRHLLSTHAGTGGTSALGGIGIRITRVRRGTVHTRLRGGLNDLRNHLVGKLLELVVTRKALQQWHRTAGNQREQCGRALHLQRLGNRGIGRDIDTGELNLAVQGVHRVAQRTGHREQAVIGRYPQEQQDREGRRSLHHCLEGVFGGVDHVPTSGRSATRLAGLGLDLMLQRLQIDGARQ